MDVDQKEDMAEYIIEDDTGNAIILEIIQAILYYYLKY